MAIPGNNLLDAVSGKLFFLIVIVIAILVILYAKQDTYTPTMDTNFVYPKEPWFSVGDNNYFVPQKIDIKSAEPYFCPRDACASQLIQKIDSAKKSIYVAIYSFTLDDVADALIRAKERGVSVRVIFDYDQAANSASEDERLIAAGVSVARRNGQGYMHNKFMVFDDEIVATGSFNYSQNANTRNDENLVFIFSSEVAEKFKKNFDLLWSASDEA